jgi:alcohol dehydrogenase
MGYESVGEVLACGSEVTTVHPGDRVVGFYGQQDYAVCREDKVIAVPADISVAVALLVILSCDAAKGVFKVRPKISESALVAGLGTMGLLAVYFLREYVGLRRVDAIEPDADRVEVGRRFGIHQSFWPEPPTAAYDVAFECSARNQAFGALQRALRPHGRLCVLSDGNYEEFSLEPAFYEKELHVVGSSDGWDYHAHARWFFEHVQHTPYLSDLYQAQVDVKDLIACYADLAYGRIRPLKVLVTY